MRSRSCAWPPKCTRLIPRFCTSSGAPLSLRINSRPPRALIAAWSWRCGYPPSKPRDFPRSRRFISTSAISRSRRVKPSAPPICSTPLSKPPSSLRRPAPVPADAAAARGRFDLVFRAVSRRLEAADTARERALALGRSDRSLGRRISDGPDELGQKHPGMSTGLAAELEREELLDAEAWNALVRGFQAARRQAALRRACSKPPCRASIRRHAALAA